MNPCIESSRELHLFRKLRWYEQIETLKYRSICILFTQLLYIIKQSWSAGKMEILLRSVFLILLSFSFLTKTSSKDSNFKSSASKDTNFLFLCIVRFLMCQKSLNTVSSWECFDHKCWMFLLITLTTGCLLFTLLWNKSILFVCFCVCFIISFKFLKILGFVYMRTQDDYQENMQAP